VKRFAPSKITVAWSITVSAAGIVSAFHFFVIRGMMLPREIAP